MPIYPPLFDYYVQSPESGQGYRSFTTIWPLRTRPCDSLRPELSARICGLLEASVACGEWQGWILLCADGTGTAREIVGVVHSSCCVCGSKEVTCFSERDHALWYCKEHLPEVGSSYSCEGESCWILVWQTRAPSNIQKQKAELRRIWNAAKWCQEDAEDFELMFHSSSLTEALLCLTFLTAAECWRLGLVHVAESICRDEQQDVVNASDNSTEETLCLEDVALPGDHPGPLQRYVERFVPLLLALPSLRRAPYSDVETVFALIEQLRESLPLHASSAVVLFHFLGIQGIQGIQKPGLPELRNLQESTNMSSYIENQIVAKVQGREIDEIESENDGQCRACASDLRLEKRVCSSCGHEVLHRDLGSNLLTEQRECQACASTPLTRVCSTCCSKLQMGVHNLTLLRDLLLPYSYDIDEIKTDGVVATVSKELPSSQIQLQFQRAPGMLLSPRLQVEAMLWFARVPVLLATSRPLASTTAHKTWLRELTVHCLSSDATITKKCRRAEVLLQNEKTGAILSPDLSVQVFTGVRNLPWASLAGMTVDVINLLQMQGAWRQEQKTACINIAEVAAVCMEDLGMTPGYTPSSLTKAVRKWLTEACKDLAMRPAALRASWWGVICQERNCGKRPCMQALLKAWENAPLGTKSRLACAFACDHAPVDEEEREGHCLNCSKELTSPSTLTNERLDGDRHLMLSRCAACKFPMSFGRSVVRPADFLRLTLKRESSLISRPSFLP